jgi:hypothetical protein
MAQEILNSNENIQIPHTVSFWFQQDWTGNYLELGDILVDSVSLTPDFLDFRSYRNSLNSLRKRLLQAKNATVGLTLNEPNAVNLQRVTFGGTIAQNQTTTALEGRHLDATSDALGDYFDMSDAGETDFGNIAVTGIYDVTDVTQATNKISANIDADTDGKVFVDATDAGVTHGTTYYVTYNVTYTGMYSSQIYGASNTTVEGAAKLQARNTQGGVVQLWDLASVNLAPNGDLSMALDAVQTVPLLATLQERSGTFGDLYTA